MKEHHKLAMEKLVELFKEDPNYLGIILSGSLAKGMQRDNSDIDVYLIATDEEFAKKHAENNTFYFNADICNYNGGYIDGKIVDYNFIKLAAERGSEPTRASFIGSYVLLSKIEGLDEIVRKIPIYDESARLKKLRSFYSQVQLWGGYFADEAIKKNNEYLLQRCITELVFYACRYILAYNRILFPCHKSLRDFVLRAKKTPSNFETNISNLFENRDQKSILEFLNMFNEFAPYDVSDEQAASIFIEDSEWNWLNGEPPLQDC